MATKRHKPKPKITPFYLWRTFLDFVAIFLEFVVKFTSIITLIMCPITIGFVVYSTFILFDFQRALIGCIILCAMPYINSNC